MVALPGFRQSVNKMLVLVANCHRGLKAHASSSSPRVNPSQSRLARVSKKKNETLVLQANKDGLKRL